MSSRTLLGARFPLSVVAEPVIHMKNKERYEALRALSPVDAVQAWLDFKFGIDDEPAMLEAIRRDSRIRLSDEEIIDTIQNAMDEELGAQACLGKLTGMA